MAHPSAPASLVLHALRVKSTGDVAAVASATGLAAEQVLLICEELAEDDLVDHRSDVVRGWALTEGGRAAHARLAASEVEGPRRRSLHQAYQRFLSVNPELLATCTAWQLREGPTGTVLNDHSDPGWDAGVLDRLEAVHAAVQPVLAELVRCASRYRRYGERLAEALARVRGGDHAWFTRPGIDSYHTVWFELHEDLLATLGIGRATEGRL